MDVEVIGERDHADSMLGLAFNAAHYLLDNGAVLEDGDTFGLTESERLRVRHVPSVFEPFEKVYRLELC